MDMLPLPPRGERGRKQISSICPLDEMARTCAKKESAAALLFFSQQHQDNAVHNARERAEHDDRPRDDEHLRRHAGDEALALKVDGGGDDGVGKARDRHERAGPGKARDGIVKV